MTDLTRGIRFDPALLKSSRILVGLLLIFFGLLIIAATALLEQSAREAQVWGEAIFTPEGEVPWENVLLIRTRRVPISHFPNQQTLLEEARRRLRP